MEQKLFICLYEHCESGMEFTRYEGRFVCMAADKVEAMWKYLVLLTLRKRYNAFEYYRNFEHFKIESNGNACTWGYACFQLDMSEVARREDDKEWFIKIYNKTLQ